MKTLARLGLAYRAASGLTPRATRVVRLAGEIARRRGDGFIGTEHLFLALLAEGTNPPATVLRDLEVARQARDTVEALLDACN